MKRLAPSQVLLRERFIYNADTGIFYWRISPTPRIKIGDIAGRPRHNGYIFIGVKGFGQIGAHRLAWIYTHGPIPDNFEIDHADTDTGNNRLSNLRLATSTQQKRNKKVQSNSRSGLKGAFFHASRTGKKWRSQIKKDGKYIFLGYYHTAEEAAAAYQIAAPKYFGEFARLT